jgi:hypothetical protein
MKHRAPLFGAVLCVLLLGSVDLIAQTVKGVASSGGISATQGDTRLMGTIGQSAIGVTQTLSTEANIGFWHTQSAKTTSAYVGNDATSSANALALSSNPNPFSKSTTLSFTVPQAGHVSLVLYNSIGQPVRTLLQRELEAGTVRERIDFGELPSGNYTAVLRVGDTQATTALRLVD